MDDEGNPEDFHEARKRKRSPLHQDLQSGFFRVNSTQESRECNPASVEGHLNELDPANKRIRHLDAFPGLTSSVQEHTSRLHGQSAMSELPPELLQHIFSFLDPISLGRLLCVGKTFNALLDPRRPLPQASGLGRHLSIQSQDSIWAASRKLYHLGFPRPLSGMSELEMWRLIRGHGCQFCGKRSASRNLGSPPSPWNAGPGPDQVRIVWPFPVRTCGKCLEPQLVKETELLFSTFSSLMPAIPFAFFTPSLNYVASIILRHTSAPPGLLLTKYFFRPQVEEMKSKLVEVRSLGMAAAEEWYKGLESLGQEKISDAARFEQWEATGGPRTLSTIPSIATTPVTGTPDSTLARRNTPHPSLHSQHSAKTPRPHVVGNLPPMVTHLPPPAPGTLPNFPLKPMTPAPGQYPNQEQMSYIMPGLATHIAQPKVDRSVRDINQMKADRRAEIERRCLELEPPIKPSTLVYMDAFAAAIQIPMTLNENAWQLLKTRLLSQRKNAEAAEEEERRLENVPLQVKNEERRQHEEQLRIARENLDHADRESEEIQKPTREKIVRYADELINSQWEGGKLVKRDTAPQFAADVLIYIRKRFFEELDQEELLQPLRTPLYQFGTHSEPSSRALRLEDMKWVYETKIKPITEQFRRELFLCSVCDHNNKYYAFDAVVQHYAAKHTSSLSHGTAIVYWKSEWPEEPPFDSRPSSKYSTRQLDYFANGTSPMYSEYGFSSNAAMDRRNPTHENIFPHGLDQMWSRSAFSPMIQAHRITQSGLHDHSLPSKPVFQAANGTFQSQYDTTAQKAFSKTPLARPSMSGPHELTSPQYSADRSVMSDQSPQLQQASRRSNSVAGNTLQHVYPSGTTSNSDGQLSAHSGSIRPSAGAPGPLVSIYQLQVEDLAHHARDVWDGIDGIRGLPDSVCIQVIIHHVALKFAEKYMNEPNLALFMDALNKDSRMQPLRNLSNLNCKVCSGTSDTFSAKSGTTSNMPGVSYTLPGLLSHFQIAHIEVDRSRVVAPAAFEMTRPEWKLDMIELPAPTIIANLARAAGMTDAKLKIIADVLPKYFPTPLPTIQEITNLDEGLIGQARSTLDSPGPSQAQPALVGLPKPQRSPGIDFLGQSQQGTPIAAPHSLNRRIPLESATEDEYDPHRPAPTYSPPPRLEANGRFLPPRTEPAYPRQVIYEDARVDPYLVEPSYALERVQQPIVYRYRDYPVHEPLQRYQPEYYVRERFERVPPRPVTRDRMHRSEPYSDHRDTYTPRRTLNFMDERNIASPVEERVKRETIVDPSNETADATEQFLKNFDSIAAESYPEVEATGPSHNFASADRIGDRRAGSRLSDAAHIDHEADDVRPAENRIESLRATPMEIVRSHDGRERSRSPVRAFSRRPNEDTNFGKDRQDDQAFRQRTRAAFRGREPENEDPAESRQSRGRTEVIEYDQNGLPLTTPQAAPLHSAEMSYYRDRSPPRIYQPRRMVAPASPEFYRPHLAEGRPRYAEARAAGQYRYIEDERYYDGAYKPVEYVRVPRQSHLAGGYYVERPRDPPIEYVEHDSLARRDQIYERDGHLYRTIPPPDRRYDPYDMPTRY